MSDDPNVGEQASMPKGGLLRVGFGDVVPAARAARALTILEALIGQAIILARLVSLPTAENSPQERQ